MPGQVPVHHVQELGTKLMLLDQLPKPANRCLVRRGILSQVRTEKPLRPVTVVHQFFRLRVRQLVPDLEKIQLEHPDQPPDRTSRTIVFRIEWLNEAHQFLPGHDRVHHLEESLSPRGFPHHVEARHRQRPLLILLASRNPSILPDWQSHFTRLSINHSPPRDYNHVTRGSCRGSLSRLCATRFNAKAAFRSRGDSSPNLRIISVFRRGRVRST